jgi:hypothetical protein
VFIGKGPQDDPRYGKAGVNMGDSNFNQYYSKPLADADFEAGRTRFHWWHVDGTYWQYDPPTFTILRPIKFPTEGLKSQTVEWADGSNQSMEVKTGRTAFVDVEQLYNMLSDEEKNMVDHSWVEYMYWPYERIKGCRGAPNGLGVANEGRELPDEEMKKFEEGSKEWQKKVCYPRDDLDRCDVDGTIVPHGLDEPRHGQEVIPGAAQLSPTVVHTSWPD